MYFLFTFYIFVHIVRGQPFLMITGDQTSLQSVLCPTSDLTCGVTMFIIISKEKKKLVEKPKTTTEKPNLIPVTSFVYGPGCTVSIWFV